MAKRKLVDSTKLRAWLDAEKRVADDFEAIGALAAYEEVERQLDDLEAQMEREPRLTWEMLEHLYAMLEENDRAKGWHPARQQWRDWLEHQRHYVTPKRYTLEVTIREVDEYGQYIEVVRSGGPSEATSDLDGLDNRFDEICQELQALFYGAAKAGSFSRIDDPDRRSTGEMVR